MVPHWALLTPFLFECLFPRLLHSIHSVAQVHMQVCVEWCWNRSQIMPHTHMSLSVTWERKFTLLHIQADPTFTRAHSAPSHVSWENPGLPSGAVRMRVEETWSTSLWEALYPRESVPQVPPSFCPCTNRIQSREQLCHENLVQISRAIVCWFAGPPTNKPPL